MGSVKTCEPTQTVVAEEEPVSGMFSQIEKEKKQRWAEENRNAAVVHSALERKDEIPATKSDYLVLQCRGRHGDVIEEKGKECNKYTVEEKRKETRNKTKI